MPKVFIIENVFTKNIIRYDIITVKIEKYKFPKQNNSIINLNSPSLQRFKLYVTNQMTIPNNDPINILLTPFIE